MSILIDRQETIKEFCKQDCDCDPKDCYVGTCYEVEIIESVPPAQPRKGKWIDDGTEFGCCCSECNYTLDDYFYGELREVALTKLMNFCPNCGADMRGEQNEL